MHRSSLSILLSALLLAASTGFTQTANWVGSWGAAPLPPSVAAGPFPATPSYDDQTIRQIVRLSAGGDRLRLRLTNEYGSQPLEIGAARVALADIAGAPIAGTERVVTFGGSPTAMIATGAPLVSDAIDLPTDALDNLSISLYLPESTGPCTCHQTGLQSGYVSAPGDHTTGMFEPAETMQARAFLSGVEVQVSGPARAIVVLGDSISDGMGSTADMNRRWPDRLAERLAARDDGIAWGMVNAGISGNRVLNDGAGDSALARFDRDVLSVPGVAYVIVFEGVNDLGFAYGGAEGPMASLFASMPQGDPTAANLIAGYRQLISRAQAHGIRIFGATVAPYGGAMYFSEEGDAVRQAVNAWIRDSGEFDAVLDFDAILRDPANPSRMRADFHSGDNLHGSDAGYRAIADSIDLSLFQ